MPFTRTSELAALADQVASAMKRGDDIGMDMLRDLMPELRGTIEEVNLALREVDGLLFEGLRDEAIALHDENFARLVGRLNLEDLENWPVAERFFADEGISPPPAIDFDTLSSLESAHAELEQLQQPLDKLRRLALERGPLERRLTLLRKLRNTDSTKPVWTETIAAHEQARLAELKQQVPQAINDRDPERIAELHAELVDPEWTVPVPRDLVRATRGADVWLQLRAAVNQAEAAAVDMEIAYREAAEGLPPPDLAMRLRGMRDRWYDAHRLAAESTAALAECPTVAGLARAEGLEQRLHGLASRTADALQWLQVEDAREATTQQFQQAIATLEYLVDHPPEKKGESAWVNDVEVRQAEVMRLCQMMPDLDYSDLLRQRVEKSLASVQGRESRRRRFIVLMSVATVALVGVVIALATQGCDSARQRAAAEAALEQAVEQARAGCLAEVPTFALAAERKYADEPAFADLMEDIRRHVGVEAERRKGVQEALAAQREALQAAEQRMQAREERARLDEWPSEAVDAAQAYRKARDKGGMTKGLDLPDDCRDALAARRAEEDAIAECEQRQEELERKLRAAAVTELRRQIGEVDAVVSDLGPAPYDAAAAARAEKAIDQLMELKRIGQLDKSSRNDVLLTGDVRRRLPPDEMAAIEPVLKQLQRIVDQARNAGDQSP